VLCFVPAWNKSYCIIYQKTPPSETVIGTCSKSRQGFSSVPVHNVHRVCVQEHRPVRNEHRVYI
jgi:hypothetical protein